MTSATEESGAEAVIESRLQRLEAIEEVRRLVATYGRALDDKEFQSYVDLFAVDGAFVAGSHEIRGQQAIREMVQGMLGNRLGAERGQDFHFLMNPSIEIAPDRAAADTTLTWVYVVRDAEGGPNVAKLGHYADQVVRDEGDRRWKFRRRNAPTDIPAA